MKHLMSAFAVCLFFSVALGQNKHLVKIEEDYTNPDKRLYQPGDEYHKRSIENGLYICKPAALPASLDFGFRFDPYNNPQEKNNALYASDLDFTIIKLKGKQESFISVGFNYLYLKFSYNSLGQWKWTNYNDDKIYMEGTAAVNADTNLITLSYRIGGIRCYINGKEVMCYAFEKEQSTQYLRWENAQVFTKDKKMVLALDKVVLTGYSAGTKFPDEEAKAAAEEAAKKEEEAKKLLSENFVLYGYYDFASKKYGFRDADKTVIIPAQYDEINKEGFSDGLAGVKLNNKWGFIDKTGKPVVEMKYDYISEFMNGYAVVTMGGHPKSKYGVINRFGKEVIPPKYALIRNNRFVPEEAIAEGMIMVQNQGYGFADTNGIELVAPKYEAAKKFSEGLAAVSVNGKWGFIDKTGKEVVPAKYSFVDYFSEGFCAVNIGGKDEGSYASGGKYCFIDKTGKPITELKYYWVSAFSDGLAMVMEKEGGATQFIDPTGKTVLSLSQYSVVRGFAEGLAVVHLDVVVPGEDFPITKSGCIDKTGKAIIPLTTEYFIWHEYFSEGLIAVKNDKMKIGYMDKTGKVVIPCSYDKAEPFVNGRAKVVISDKTFFIDKTGQVLK